MGDEGADKLISEGAGDVLIGGAGNDIIELATDLATIEFGSGDGSDAVQFDLAEGDYTLKLRDLNAGDIDVIAGGFDAYYAMGDPDAPDGTWYQFLTIRDKSSGAQITFLENGLNGVFNIGPSDTNVPIGYNKGYGWATDEGQLDRIVFADGSTWSQEEIWYNISDVETWAYQEGDSEHGFGWGEYDETTFLPYVTQNYLQAFSDHVA